MRVSAEYALANNAYSHRTSCRPIQVDKRRPEKSQVVNSVHQPSYSPLFNQQTIINDRRCEDCF